MVSNKEAARQAALKALEQQRKYGTNLSAAQKRQVILSQDPDVARIAVQQNPRERWENVPFSSQNNIGEVVNPTAAQQVSSQGVFGKALVENMTGRERLALERGWVKNQNIEQTQGYSKAMQSPEVQADIRRQAFENTRAQVIRESIGPTIQTRNIISGLNDAEARITKPTGPTSILTERPQQVPTAKPRFVGVTPYAQSPAPLLPSVSPTYGERPIIRPVDKSPSGIVNRNKQYFTDVRIRQQERTKKFLEPQRQLEAEYARKYPRGYAVAQTVGQIAVVEVATMGLGTPSLLGGVFKLHKGVLTGAYAGRATTAVAKSTVLPVARYVAPKATQKAVTYLAASPKVVSGGAKFLGSLPIAYAGGKIAQGVPTFITRSAKERKAARLPAYMSAAPLAEGQEAYEKILGGWSGANIIGNIYTPYVAEGISKVPGVVAIVPSLGRIKEAKAAREAQVRKTLYDAGLRGEELDAGVKATLKEARFQPLGSFVSQSLVSGGIEAWGQSVFATKLPALGKVAYKDYWKKVAKATVVPYIGLGVAEGSFQELAQQSSLKTKESWLPSMKESAYTNDLGQQVVQKQFLFGRAAKIGLSGIMGGLSAPALGIPTTGYGVLRKAPGRSSIPYYALTTVGYGLDITEPAGDYSYDLFGKPLLRGLGRAPVSTVAALTPTSVTFGAVAETAKKITPGATSKNNAFTNMYSRTQTSVRTLLGIPTTTRPTTRSQVTNRPVVEIPTETRQNVNVGPTNFVPTFSFNTQTYTYTDTTSITNTFNTVPTTTNVPVFTPQLPIMPGFYIPFGMGQGSYVGRGKRKYVDELSLARDLIGQFGGASFIPRVNMKSYLPKVSKRGKKSSRRNPRRDLFGMNFYAKKARR